MTTTVSRFLLCALITTQPLCSIQAAPAEQPAPAKTSMAESPRSVYSLDEGWRFHLGAAPDAIASDYNDSEWRQLDVPHDYVIEGAFTPTTPNENRVPGSD